MNETQLRSELATEVHFLSVRSQTDELHLSGRDSENRSENRFPSEGRAVAVQNITQRAVVRRLVVGPSVIGS